MLILNLYHSESVHSRCMIVSVTTHSVTCFSLLQIQKYLIIFNQFSIQRRNRTLASDLLILLLTVECCNYSQISTILYNAYSLLSQILICFCFIVSAFFSKKREKEREMFIDIFVSACQLIRLQKHKHIHTYKAIDRTMRYISPSRYFNHVIILTNQLISV